MNKSYTEDKQWRDILPEEMDQFPQGGDRFKHESAGREWHVVTEGSARAHQLNGFTFRKELQNHGYRWQKPVKVIPSYEDPEPQVHRLDKLRSLILRIRYKQWSLKVGLMGHGHFLQVILNEVNEATGKPWTGRKWYLSPYMTDSEVVATAFKAILTAEEHETRESFLFDNLPIYGPHQSLEALKSSAGPTDHRH